MSARDTQVHWIRKHLTNPRELCARLGLLGGYKEGRQARGGLLIRCPAHQENTPSCSVTIGSDGTLRVKCFACNLAGDVFSLVASAHGLDVGRDFPRVRELAAQLANAPALEDLDSSSAKQSFSFPAKSASRAYPPRDEVEDLWNSSRSVCDDHQAVEYLRARCLDPEKIELFSLARVLSPDQPMPSWANCGGKSWVESEHRLVVRMFDDLGCLRSLRATRISENNGPKRLAPATFSTTGLVMACGVAQKMLDARIPPERFENSLLVVISEGEPDWLTNASELSEADENPPANLGVVASSWSAEIAARIPERSRVVIRTHQDPTGDRYAAQIIVSLQHRDLDIFDLERGGENAQGT